MIRRPEVRFCVYRSLKFDFKFWDSDEETVVESVIDGQSAAGVDTGEVLSNKEIVPELDASQLT